MIVPCGCRKRSIGEPCPKVTRKEPRHFDMPDLTVGFGNDRLRRGYTNWCNRVGVITSAQLGDARTEKKMEAFRFGCIVQDEHYCPRPELEAQLRRYVRSGQNVVLQGERRMGKSSLVVKVVNGIRGTGLLYVDLLGISTPSDFCRRVVDGIVELDSSRSFLRKTVSLLSSLRPLVVLDQDTGLPKISIDARSATSPAGIGAVMAMVAAHARERRICAVFDEFQDILDLPDANQALAEMRSRVQFMSETPFVFLGSVRNRMREIFSHPSSPFFKSAVAIDVGEMERGAFADFLAKRFSVGRRSADRDFLLGVVDDLGGVPGDVQELCDALWYATGPGDRVDAASLDAAYEYIFAHERTSYETYWKTFSPQQRRVLRALAACGGRHVSSSDFFEAAGVYNASSVKKALSRLETLGHVYRFRDEFKFANPFFREWLRRRF